jgi:hypothetical protein
MEKSQENSGAPDYIGMLATAEKLALRSAAFRAGRLVMRDEMGRPVNPTPPYGDKEAREDASASALLIIAAMQRPIAELTPHADRIVQMLNILVATFAKEPGND